MNQRGFEIRNAFAEEFKSIGKLMIEVYSRLEGFPDKLEQPEYYKMLLNVGKLTEKKSTKIIVAISSEKKIMGAVVFFGDMKNYGSGGTATGIKNSAGFRLLAVTPSERGKGIGKLLSMECIDRAKKMNKDQLIIHSTESMKIAWKMYEKLGFTRYHDIDFLQEKLPIFGFRLKL